MKKATKATNADCIRRAINISSQKDFFKFDKKSFNPALVNANIPITSPKLVELMTTIQELDKNDMAKYGKKFKHIIYSDLRSSIAGIKLVAAVLTSYGMSNIYKNNLKVSIPDSNDNFALLSSLATYDKPFPVKLRKDILTVFNERPGNIYGEKVRFLLIDQGYKEGIDVYDVKYIHLVDDLTTPSDEKQAIGRGTRFCGQKGLEFHPELGWPLHIFKYKLEIDKSKYGEEDAFMLYIKESGIDIKKLYFAAELESICRFGAVDYEINKAIHEFGNEKEDNLEKKDIFVGYERLMEFKVKDMYESLDREQNGDFKMLKKAYNNFGGALKFNFKKTQKFIDITKVKELLPNLEKPLDFIDMRKYVRKYFNKLKWSNLEFKNMCLGDDKEKKNDRIVSLSNSQAFVSNYFNSKSCYKGILFWHSVGTGKTCSAIATASSSFEKDGYTILWVTRHTLKPDIWKNIYTQVCSQTIKEKIEMGMNIPEKDVKAPLKYLDDRWVTPLSYKQFTNLINGKNEFYKEMVKRNGKADPFKKTLIIIDEAHKLFAEDTPAQERPDVKALKRALYQSYGTSKKESCKLLLMTATPYTNDPMQLFKLLNLMRERDYFDEDFDSFKDKYLDPNTYKFRKDMNKEFLDRITGYISYLNRERDVRNFAYPVIYTKKVNYSSIGSSTSSVGLIVKILDDIKDYLSIHPTKATEIIEYLKEISKKPKKTTKTTDIITQEEALDLCITPGKKGAKKDENNDYDEIKDFIKEINGKLKDFEKEEKKKAKELEKEEKKKAKELEKEEKKKAKETNKKGAKKKVKSASPKKSKTPSPKKSKTPSPKKSKTPSPKKSKSPSPKKSKSPSPIRKTPPGKMGRNSAATIIQKKLKGFMYPFVNRVSTNINDREVYFRKLIKHLKVDVKSKNNCLQYEGMKDGKPVFKIGSNIILKTQIGTKSKNGVAYLSGFKDVEGKLYKYAVKIGKREDLNREEMVLEKLRMALVNHESFHFPFLYATLYCDSLKKEFSKVSEGELKEFPQILNALYKASKSKGEISILLNELANGDLKSFCHINYKDGQLMHNALVQVVLSLFSFYATTEMQHCDSHWGNFLYHKIRPGGYIHYKIASVDYYLENLGYLWVIWDFGLSRPFSEKAVLMNYDIGRILYAFMNKKQKGWLEDKLKYEPTFTNNVADIINDYFVLNKNLYNRFYTKALMTMLISSMFKNFAKLGWISTIPPSDKKMIINDKPYVISF
jgi:hypothetical protein